MPVDKLMAAQAGFAGMYGLQIGVSPKTASKTCVKSARARASAVPHPRSARALTQPHTPSIAPPILRRFYGNDSPAKSETGVGQWLGFTNCIMGATFGVLSTADLSKSDKKKLYTIGAASCAAGSAIAQHQVGSKGFDKTQATVATVLNVAMGAMYAKKLLE